ncbi:DUF4190 domain-containing protein [Demequina activiva]|uniref:DUF4190 domain-containing protein n=1 Tax=Demequina activiva TaxID=1582364 RepID=A0A919UHM1_9MICO|nr:DUF4190 domain-containing protein [Demequina activiva]GIG55614.1 hypothetical protein Dac01nite_23660 [Demequina activiva]
MSNPDKPEQPGAAAPGAQSPAADGPAASPWEAIIGQPVHESPAQPSEETPGATTDAAPEATAEAPVVEPAPEPAPAPASADPAPTEVIDPVQDAPDAQDHEATQVLDPVVLAGTASDTDGVERPSGVEEPQAEPVGEPDRDWMGVTAFITGALLLSPVAIILGHLGLGAAKRGRARHRSFAIAGLVLGYLGLIATVAGVYLLLTQTTSPEAIDAQAQQDVTAVGAAAATHAVETGALPDVEQVDAGYSVAGETIAPHLETQHALTFTGTTATDWCLEITYAGGNQTAMSYTATGGMAQGACSAE